jgi:HAD superfamily hydrolase (TIGR01509 family)
MFRATIPREIRAVVFDLDGVLIDSAPYHRAAFEEVFRPLGLRDFDYSHYAGWRTADVVENVLRDAGREPSPDLVREIARKKSRIAREKLTAANPVAPDCPAVLEELARHYALALASSGSRQSVDLFLAAHPWARLFRSVLCGDDVEQAKPSPEIYARTFDVLRVAPAEGVVVEDASAGVLAARGAGAGAVIGLAGTSSAAQLAEAGAGLVIRSLSEIPALLCPAYERASPHGN